MMTIIVNNWTVDEAGRAPDVEDHQLGQAPGVHQRGQRQGLPGGHPHQPGGHAAADELADAGHGQDAEQGQHPAPAQAPHVDVETGDHEEDRQQDHHADALDPLGHLVAEGADAPPGYRGTEQERADEPSQADQVRHLGAGQRTGQQDGKHVGCRAGPAAR